MSDPAPETDVVPATEAPEATAEAAATDEPAAAPVDAPVWPDLTVADLPLGAASAISADAEVVLPDFDPVDPEAFVEDPPFADAVPLALAGIDLSVAGTQPVSGTVSLVDVASGRTLDIVMGRPDAALAQEALTGEAPPRPRAHDLLLAAVDALDGVVAYVAIVERRPGGVYVANVGVRKPDGAVVVLDARPSDAVNVALRSHGASIWAATALLGVIDN